MKIVCFVCICVSFGVAFGGIPFLPPKIGVGTSHRDDKQRADVEREECDPIGKRYEANGDDECSYRECVSKKWQLNNCPEGKGVLSQLISGTYRGQGNPCSVTSPQCRRSLEEKGLSNVDVQVCQMDLVLCIDISCSLDKNRGALKNFVNSLVQYLPISNLGVQLGGIAFSEKTYHISYMNSYKYAGIQYLRRPSAYARKVFGEFSFEPDQCATRGDLALNLVTSDYFTHERGRRPLAKPVVIYCSDGVTYPEEFKADTIQAAKDLKATGIHVVVLALPNDKQPMSAGVEEWEAIASAPAKDNIIYLSSFEELKTITQTLLGKACQTI